MAKTILLADDSLTIQKVVELTFMDQNYKVLAVGDGDTALARWADSQPDLVIADVHMPGADGYEVCRQVKASRPGTPVLLLVGTFETFDDGQAASCGANGHLKKPFDSQELFRLVERLIADSPPAQAAPAPPSFAAPPAFAAPPSFAAPPAPAAPTASAPPAFESFEAAPEAEDLFAPRSPAPAPTFSLHPSPVPPVLDEPPAFESAPAPTPSRAAAPLVVPQPYEAPAPPAPAPVAAAPNVDTRPTPVRSAPAAAEEEEAGTLSAADVDRIARRVVELMGEKAVKDIAWEVVPDLAEVVIKERIRELENQVQ